MALLQVTRLEAELERRPDGAAAAAEMARESERLATVIDELRAKLEEVCRICVCAYIYMCFYIYIYTCIYVYLYTCIYICIYTYMYIAVHSRH